MAGALDKPADLEWVHKLKHGGPFPFADSLPCSRSWASAPGHNFVVRGPHYLETKAKVIAGEPLLQPIAFDVVKSSSKIFNIMDHPQCRLRAALCAARESAKLSATMDGVTDGHGEQEEPFVWVFNLQLPSKENHSLVIYFLSSHSPEKGSLMQRFLDEGDAFRRERLKMLLSFPTAPRFMNFLKNEEVTGSLIGKILNCRYTREKEYMEVDADMGSAMITRTAFHLCGGFSVHVTVEFAFLIEGRHENELPERIVGAIRLANLDLSTATSLDGPLRTQSEPVSRDKQKTSYRAGLWKSLSTHVQAGRRIPAKDVDGEKLCDGTSKSILLP